MWKALDADVEGGRHQLYRRVRLFLQLFRCVRCRHPITQMCKALAHLHPCNKNEGSNERFEANLNLYQVPYYLYWRSLFVRSPLAPC